MKPFTETQAYKHIITHYTKLYQPAAVIRSQQQSLIQTILDHPSFNQISVTLHAIQSSEGVPLSSADLAFVELKALQLQASKQQTQNYKNKLHASIQKLQSIISLVQDYKSTAMAKLNWLSVQNGTIMQERQDIQEEIEIMRAQGSKNVKKKVKNTQGSSKQLQELLANYQCRNGFPRNKTEVLMLINRLQARIQHLQMKKIADYQIHQ